MGENLDFELRSNETKGFPGLLATAVFVLPPCWVILGRHLILTAPRVNESSDDLLDQT
jgi:hypothetical protein